MSRAVATKRSGGTSEAAEQVAMLQNKQAYARLENRAGEQADTTCGGRSVTWSVTCSDLAVTGRTPMERVAGPALGVRWTRVRPASPWLVAEKGKARIIRYEQIGDKHSIS